MEKNINNRIEIMKNRVVNTKPELDLENALIMTDVFKRTMGEPLIIQKAKAFYGQCKRKTIFIQDKELIVGCAGSKIRGGILCADTCWSILDKEIDTISARKYDPFYVKKEDREDFLNEIKPFWEGKSTYEAWLKQIPEKTRLFRDNGVIYIDRKAVRGFGETTAGYSQIINEGIVGIRKNILDEKQNLDICVAADYSKIKYLDALLIVCDGIEILASRYAYEAKKLAEIEKDNQRKNELLQIEQICSRVPRYPATNFREAVQSLYFYQICLFMEQNAASYNPGRMDQYLYPFYKNDIENGVLTKEDAKEILNCLWIKFSEPCLFQDANTAEFAAGYPMFQNVCVGGVDSNGQDAVNDLSYLILEASMEVKLYQPSLSVRYSLSKNPTKFLRKVVELIKLGTGFPAFHNDDIGIRMLMNKGVPLKEAYNWNPCGCVETNLEGRMKQYTALADINLGSMVEFVLNNGKSLKYNNIVSKIKKDILELNSFEEFLEATKYQIIQAIEACVAGSHVIDDICSNRQVPVLSLSHKECISKKLDYSQGGAKYNIGNGIILIGVADLINSLAAVKYLIYDEKKLSMKQLIEALKNNYRGYDDILNMCINAPKYGNDNEYVDKIASDIFTFIADEIEKYSGKFGKMTPGILPVSGNTPFGLEVSALPSGRLQGKPLADGVSPSAGTDCLGPSAVLKSVSRLPHDRYVQGTLLNMKIEPDYLKNDNGINQMMALLKTLCSLGIYHVQFNVIDRETLLKAQKDPKNYKSLLVRVAGYTAYFVELGEDVQNEIIARTSFKL